MGDLLKLRRFLQDIAGSGILPHDTGRNSALKAEKTRHTTVCRVKDAA